MKDCIEYVDEMWRPVIGFPSYLVSNKGRIKNITNQFILTASLRASGFNGVQLYGHRKKSVRNVHTIVAEAFLGPRPKSCMVVHLDGNRRNDASSNLAYRPLAERVPLNEADMLGFNPKLTIDQAREIRALAQSDRASLREIANIYGVSVPHVVLIKQGKKWTDIDVSDIGMKSFNSQGMEMKRRTYSLKFKQEVVAELKLPGAKITQVAQRLSVHPGVLRRWFRESVR